MFFWPQKNVKKTRFPLVQGSWNRKKGQKRRFIRVARPHQNRGEPLTWSFFMIFPIFDKKSQKNTTNPYRTQKGTFRDPKKRHFLKKVISGGGGGRSYFFFRSRDPIRGLHWVPHLRWYFALYVLARTQLADARLVEENRGRSGWRQSVC